MTSAPPRWDDAAVRSPGGHVLQSSAWAALRERQGWRAEFVRVGDPLPKVLVLWRELPLGQRFGYAPRGPVVAPGDLRGFAAALERLASLARERDALFVKVDPELSPDEAGPAFRAAGFRRGSDVQPVVATLELDLAPDEDALLAGLDKDTRWSVRTAQKRGIALRDARSEADVRAFGALYEATGKRAGFLRRAPDYYQEVWRALIAAGFATLHLALRDGEPVAGAMTWRCGERDLYMYAASSDAGRRAFASYALVWRCIMAARRRGAKRFDFGGIPRDPTRRDDPMYGPYLFKKGFGGVVRRWVGAHDAAPRALPYRMYRLAEPLARRLQ